VISADSHLTEPGDLWVERLGAPRSAEIE